MLTEERLAELNNLPDGIHKLSEVEYRAITALNHSSIEWIQRSRGGDHGPELFKQNYIDGNEPEKTPGQEQNLVFGNLFHTLLLEANEFNNRYMEMIPPINEKTEKPYGKDTKKYLTWYDEQQPLLKGRDPVSREEIQMCYTMINNIKNYPDVYELFLKFDKKEYVCIYTHEKYGKLKCKIDLIADGIIADAKTSATDAFLRFKSNYKVEQFGYHRQAAFYKQLYVWSSNLWVDGIYLIPFEKEGFNRITPYNFSDDYMGYAWNQVELALDEIRDRKITGNWFDDQLGRNTTLELRAYA